MYIDNTGHIALWLTIMEGPQLLRLCWHSVSRWGRECFTFILAYKGSQKSVHNNWQPFTPQITHDTQRTIVDARLNLIFMMRQGGYCILFCL